MTAELQGFSIAKQAGLRLGVDQVARVDLTLAVGGASETVEVQAATVALDSETATVGQVMKKPCHEATRARYPLFDRPHQLEPRSRGWLP